MKPIYHFHCYHYHGTTRNALIFWYQFTFITWPIYDAFNNITLRRLNIGKDFAMTMILFKARGADCQLTIQYQANSVSVKSCFRINNPQNHIGRLRQSVLKLLRNLSTVLTCPYQEYGHVLLTNWLPATSFTYRRKLQYKYTWTHRNYCGRW